MNAIKDYINPVLNELRESRIRVHEDWRKESPGFKFNEWEVKGAPLRLEIGLRDIQKNSTMVFRRDTGEKKEVDKSDLVKQIPELLDKIQSSLFNQALQFRKNNTHTVSSYDEFKKIIENNDGFVRCGWDGDIKTEEAIKNETKATIRVIHYDEKPKNLVCIYSGKPAMHEVIFAKAY